ncbi:MAG: aminopeptidase P N-terminal domain-containing protein, partial [Actinobacteria bacterium]|nr:aminopeptidase P N-terminal domain-containing protein [Actinomycetota bacterium]
MGNEPHARSTATPEALARFMATGWAEPAPRPRRIASSAPWCAARRRNLAAWFPEDWLVVPTGRPKTRAGDTEYPFRPGSDFAWLTSYHEPCAVVVLAPGDEGHHATLFMPRPVDRTTPRFFTDSRSGELWVGSRPGLDEVAATHGIATAPLDELPAYLKEAPPSSLRCLTGVDAPVDATVSELRTDMEDGGARDDALRRTLAHLRLVKDEYEIASIRQAVDATVRGFEDIAEELRAGRATSERWIEGTFRRRARSEGADVAYSVIVGAGAHACTLHWARNDGRLRPGELVLIDAGVESAHLYAADVTRTLPVSGRFDPTQREVYEAVWHAQQAALHACRPGNDFMAPHRAATTTLAAWLADRGLPLVPPDEAAEDTSSFSKRFTLHGTSHMLGLDVHDCA